MSGRRRRSESLWDTNEAQNEAKEFNSGGDSLKQSISEINDVLMSDDFSMQGNENILTDNDNISDKYRMKTDSAFDDWDGQYGQPQYGQPYSRVVSGKDSARSRSPHRTKHRDQDQDQDRDHYRSRPRDHDRTREQDWDRDRDRDRGRTRGLAKSRSRSRSRSRDREQSRARSPSRGVSNRLDNNSTKKWSNNRPEYSGDSQYYRTHRSGYNDQDHRRQSNQEPCKFFMMGRCNRSSCRFSHDVPKSEAYEGRSQDHNNLPNSNPNFDDNNKSWKDPQLNNLNSGHSYNMGLDENRESQFIPDSSDNRSISLNGNGPNRPVNDSVTEGGKPLETNNTPQASILPQISQNLNFTDALGLLYSTVVNEPVKASALTENQRSTEPVGKVEANENKVAEKSNTNLGKTEAEGKVDEGNMGNDEKAMRAFKIALVDFVKEILKPTWKEGKMSREVYKTIVKKVVEKVTSTMQGIQIPRTQEKTEQYLTFSKSKISKLVEAYVGRLMKA